MFAAIFTRASRRDPREYASAEALLSALFPFKQPDTVGAWSNDRAVIAHGVIHNTPNPRTKTLPRSAPTRAG